MAGLRTRHMGIWIALFCSVALFVGAVSQVKSLPRKNPAPEVEVVLPLFVQVAMAAGDRYLAANGATIRALVTSTERMQPDEYALLSQWQEHASWLNPAHEDNYYIAAAILPWNGQIDAAQRILKRASLARPDDYQPAFLYAFHEFYFRNNREGAAEWLRMSAERLSNPDEQLLMQNLAARWLDKNKDLDNAIAMVGAIASQAKRQDFKRYLDLRVERLKILKSLRAHAEIFQQRNQRPLRSVAELVSAGIIKAIPEDPFKFGYEIDTSGVIQLRTSPAT